MRGKKIFFFLFMVPLLSYALPEDWSVKIDKANHDYINKKYKEANDTYTEFLKIFNEKNILDLADKAIYVDVRKSGEETDSIIKAFPALPFIKQALEAENQKKMIEARDAYFLAREHFVKNKITNIRFFDETIQGILDDFLVKRKRQSLSNVSYAFLEQVKKDKERKKRIIFLDFEKDPLLDFDIQALVMRALYNVIENKKSFIISDKTFTGPLKNQIAEARKSGIDLVITGSYKKLKNDEVGLSFFILDAILNKKLIEINAKTPMDFEFFEFIEKIANDLEKKLKNYSRLEDFITIKYSKQGKQGYTQEFIKEGTERNIVAYLDTKIFDLETAYVKSIEKNPNKILNYYNLLALEIQSFNKKDFPLKLSMEDYVLKEKELIKKTFIKAEEIYPFMVDMSLSREHEFYENYYESYGEIKEKILEANEDYPGLKPVFDEIDLPVENDKKEVDEIVAKIGTRLKYRHGIKLGGSWYHKSPFRKSHTDGTDLGYGIKQEMSANLSYAFEKRVFSDFWFYFNLGVEAKTYTLTPLDYNSKGLNVLIGGGLKYYLNDQISVFQGFAFASPTLVKNKDPNGLFEVKQEEGFYWILGGEYIFSLFKSFDLGISLQYGISLNSQKLLINNLSSGIEEKQRFWDNFAQIAVTGYFNKSEYNVKPKEHSDTGFWMSALFSPLYEMEIELKDSTGNSKSVKMECTSFGFGVSYRIYSNLGISWDNYLIGFQVNGDKDNLVGNAKGILSKLLFEVEYFSFFDFIGLYLCPEISLTYFYQKSDFQLKDPMMGTYQTTDGLSRFYFGIKPIGELGLKFKLTREMNLKFYGEIPFSIVGKTTATQFGFKLEFKI